MRRNSSSPSLLSTIRPSERKETMLAPQRWIVCEKSGRWTAALRTTFARDSEVEVPPRLREVRTLEELSSHLNEHEHDLALIEVAAGNLPAVLDLLVRRGP